MKNPTLLVIEREDVQKLDLLKKVNWGILADLNSINTKEELEDIGVDAYCKNLTKPERAICTN